VDPNFAAVSSAEPVGLLDEQGTLRSGKSAPLDEDTTFAAVRSMMLTRHFDARSFSLQRQGRFGTISPVHGQEASSLGAALAVDPQRDWLVPQYRELPALLNHGLPLERFALYFMGHPAGGFVPEGVKVLPLQIGIAAQLPQAVGLAWGIQHQGSDGVVIAFCGDGGSSEGDFHEALNLAGVRRAPVVFVVQNNGWAISTPTSSQTATSSIAARAPGYGMPGYVVDGNDLFAVTAVVGEAVAQSREGQGPALIETLTYRMGAHNTADDPSRYADPQELEIWRSRDPIVRLQRYLQARGRWDDDVATRVQTEVEAEVEAALERAWSFPPPAGKDLMDHVYADEPLRFRQQRGWVEDGEAPA
jgi:pyruvate dehydrogenase E1 component alpha subunit